MPHKFIEGLTTADVAFQATGKDLKELFESSALALFEVMVDPNTIKSKKEFKIEITKKTLEELLFSFLEELIFLKDAEAVVFNKTEIEIKENEFTLTGTAFGDHTDHTTQEMRVDAKAVTMHHFKVEKTEEGYAAQVIIDI